jgi:hypothetical protein
MDHERAKGADDTAKSAIADAASKIGDKPVQAQVNLDKAKGSSNTNNLTSDLRETAQDAANHSKKADNDN